MRRISNRRILEGTVGSTRVFRRRTIMQNSRNMTDHKNTVRTTGGQYGFLYAIIAVSAITALLLFAYSLLFLTPSFTNLIAKNTEDEAVRLATYISHDLFQAGQPFEARTLPRDLPERIGAIVRDFDLMKVKIFSPSGETVFSTSVRDIGKLNTREYFHNIVARGNPYTKIVRKDTKSLEEQIVSLDVVETYVPWMDGDTFLGAFEIYFNITESKANLDHLVSRSNTLLQIISGTLLLVILIISLKAKRNIQARLEAEQTVLKQSEELHIKNSELSILNEISAAISRSIDMDILLPAVLDTIASRFKTFSTITRGGIFLVAGDHLHLTAHLGKEDSVLKARDDISMSECECLCSEAARTGKIIFSGNDSDNPESEFCCSLCGKSDEPCGGHVILPLKSGTRVVGVLYLHTDVQVTIRDKENLLKSIGNQVGLAIDNANLYQETKRLSLHDPLTGLPNRRLMDTTLEQALDLARRYSRPVSIGMADIDYFKKYNDTKGHAAGDRALAHVASMIKKEIREADFVARYGGEEFLILFNESRGRDAVLAAERIRKTIEAKSGVTISIGIASYVEGDGTSELVKRADEALYAAKEKGRNRVEYIT